MRAIGLLLVLVCVTSLPASAQEAADGAIATAIRDLEHEWVEGQSRNDNRALNLIFDNALVYIEYGKLMTKGDYLLRVRSAKPQLPPIVMEAMTVRTFGRTALVESPKITMTRGLVRIPSGEFDAQALSMLVRLSCRRSGVA